MECDGADIYSKMSTSLTRNNICYCINILLSSLFIICSCYFSCAILCGAMGLFESSVFQNVPDVFQLSSQVFQLLSVSSGPLVSITTVIAPRDQDQPLMEPVVDTLPEVHQQETNTKREVLKPKDEKIMRRKMVQQDVPDSEPKLPPNPVKPESSNNKFQRGGASIVYVTHFVLSCWGRGLPWNFVDLR